MSLEWTQPSLTVYPELGWTQQVLVRGHVNTGSGEYRQVTAVISWNIEGNNPAESVLLADVEAIWDAITGRGFTIIGAGQHLPNGGFAFDLEKS